MATLPNLRDIDYTKRAQVYSPEPPGTSSYRPTSAEGLKYAQTRGSTMAGAPNPAPGVASPTAPAAKSGLGASLRAGARRVAEVTKPFRENRFLRGTGALHVGLSALQAAGEGLKDDSTSRYARRFNVEEPTGDGSFGDVAKFAALRAGGFASDLGNALFLGAPGRLYRDYQQDRAAAAAAPPKPVTPDERVLANAPGAPVPTGSSDVASGVDASVNDGLRGGRTAVSPGPSAERDIGYGIRRIDQAGQSPLYTNRANPDAPLQFAPRTPEEAAANRQRNIAGYEQARQDLRTRRAMEMGLADRGDPNYYLTGPGSQQGQSSSPAPMDPASDPYVQQARKGLDSFISELESKVRSNTATRSERADLARAVTARASGAEALGQALMQDATTRRGDDSRAASAAATTEATLRGQDVTMAGYQTTDARARARAAQEQANSDRQFQLDAAKYGEARAENLRKGREESAKNLTARLAAMLPPGADGKPDAAMAAQYAEGMNAMVARLTGALEQRVRSGQATPAQLEDYRRFSELGVGALDEADIRTLMSGMQLRDVRRENAPGSRLFEGLVPWASVDVDSPAPVLSLRPARPDETWHGNRLGTPYIDDQGGVIPRSLVDRERLLGNRSERFDILKKDQQR